MLAQRIREGDVDAFFRQLGLQLQEEFVHHPQDDVLIECLEAHDRIQAVAELRREQALDVGHLVPGFTRVGEADGGLVHGLGTRVGGHDDNHIAEVSLAPIVVGQRAVVHDLQQHVENVGVCLLDFVEQQDRVWLLGDGLGQQAPLIKSYIARRRADQATHGMALHVLGHVKADEVNPHDEGQLLGGLGLAHTGGATEEKRADRLVGLAQPRARHLDRG